MKKIKQFLLFMQSFGLGRIPFSADDLRFEYDEEDYLHVC
jgi:hypothetical protein